MDHITELFCILDDFCKIFNESLEKSLISDQNQSTQKSALSLSEVMTIVILFHESYYSQGVIDSLNIFIVTWSFLSGNQLSLNFLAITVLLKLCLVVYKH